MAKKRTGKTIPSKNNAGTQLVFLFLLLELTVAAILFLNDRTTAIIYMLPALAIITFGGWFIVYRNHAETAFFLNAVLLLTFGTMVQCMLLSEDIFPKSLFMFYCIAFVAGILSGFLYKRLNFIASARCTLLLIALSALLYIVTLFLGSSGAGGVTNWISIGSFSFQPSEFIKGMYVLIMAGLLCTKENPGRKRILCACAVTLMNLGFLILQGEFGTILLILGTFISLIFLFVPDIKVFVIIVAAGAGVGALGVSLCSILLKVGGSSFLVRQIQKIVNRFAPWLYLNFGFNPTNLSPEEYRDANYQVLQARKALLNSHFLGSDTTTYIPNKANDSVFPALTESCGILIALIVFILFGLLILRGTRIFHSCKYRYHQAVAAGLVIQITLQAIIIIGGSIGLLPLTGITLPLISSGGSSLVATFMYLAVILSISTGDLWNGRRNYSHYAAKLHKTSANNAEHISNLYTSVRSRSDKRNIRR